jgi:hypothetical protein
MQSLTLLPESRITPLFPWMPLIILIPTLPAVSYKRTTDDCGCFSFRNFTFQIVSGEAGSEKEDAFFMQRVNGL